MTSMVTIVPHDNLIASHLVSTNKDSLLHYSQHDHLLMKGGSSMSFAIYEGCTLTVSPAADDHPAVVAELAKRAAQDKELADINANKPMKTSIIAEPNRTILKHTMDDTEIDSLNTRR